MKRKSETNRQNPAEKYYTPTATVIILNMSRVLCQSGNRSMGENELNEDDFEQL